eukprot:CAMPEP_0181064662 /NCGR_PEP_ID=MMETSP1070-20121207/24314_1 /TAXON_ID=265543 /ORGANISM="Minutocellus polymorphus, Strain NH13" /LENGTH=452 /DNA_ID=CAMNT_0023144979 /DNA_START=155 /DNA_END=1513 /DNA_ORIENTATION=+
MGDTASLRTVLSQTDMSQPAIQSSAAAMMKFYDKTAAPLAVSEWRSQLQSCRLDQLLPLLYVANEVLQISKRNRGPKFLEAFAEVLGSSLRFVCERDRSIVEKVRRTAKIWGDRQVYSTRFVGQLLGGLEDLRGSGGGGGSSSGGGGGPPPTSSAPSTASSASAAAASTLAKRSVTDDEDDKTDSHRPSVPARVNPSCLLIFPPRPRRRRAGGSAGAAGGSSSKRRRSSASTGADNGGASSSQKAKGSRPAKKKKVTKSTSAMVSLFESLTSLDDRYRSSCAILDSIEEAHLNDPDESLADVVGDELIDLNRGAAAAARTLKRQERALHGIATEKRLVEGEIATYIPWLRSALEADEEELAFCNKLENSLKSISIVHAEAKERREKQRVEEAKVRAQQEAERKMREDEEERKRSLEKAMKAPDQEDKPDMKWNPVTREYQYVGDVTEESWRD